MNQISQLATKLGANIDDISKGIALDPRIGPHFLQAGIGYGGSCFPKDVRALIQTAKAVEVETHLLDAIEAINQAQKQWIVEKLQEHFNNQLSGLTVGIWGLSFKPGTNDMREASSLVAIQALLDAGVNLRVYDPVAIPEARQLFADDLPLDWCDSPYEVLASKIDALVIATEWSVFKNYPLPHLKNQLKGAPLFDGRNCYELSAVIESKIHYYYSIGRPPIGIELKNSVQ